MINLLKHKPFLELLASCQPDQQQALLEAASPEQVHCLCLCAENVRGEKYIMSKKELQPYQHNIKKWMEKKANTCSAWQGFLGDNVTPDIRGTG